jgi:flagellar L-ring protein FlgH
MRSDCRVFRMMCHVVVAATLMGCRTVQPPPSVMLPTQADLPRTTRSFIADRKAERVGDLVTVVISEAASVNARSRTSAKKQEGANAHVEQLPGDRNGVGAGLERQFDGGGQVERSGRVLATLAATVVEADGAGRLRISGEQLLLINDERQVLRLDGYVRAEDIGPDNAISSQRVALSRIELSGQGILGSSQAPGWLTRLFMWARQ